MKKLKSRRCAGFSLLEALLASMLLGIAVAALLGVSNHSMAHVTSNSDIDAAWMVLDKALVQVEMTGIEKFIEMDETQGMNEEFHKPFNWEITTTWDSTIGNLYEVDISVTWMSGESMRSIEAQTMMNGEALAQ